MPAHVPPVADERESLIAFLDQQRDAFAAAAFGLTEEQIRLAPTAGTLSIGGLIKHVTTCERGWTEHMAAAPDAPSRQSSPLRSRPPRGVTTSRSPTTTRSSRCCSALCAQGEVTRSVLRARDLGAAVAGAARRAVVPQDVEAWSVRWVAMHIVEELARHAGHADIVRESIDGATMYELVAAREGWPETEWLKPWRPAAPVR